MTRCAVLLIALFPLAALAAEPQAKPRPSTDDELKKQLRARPIDDVDRELFGPVEPEPGARPDQPGGADPAAKPGEDLPRKLGRELGPAGVPEDANPLLSVLRQMREAEGLIGRWQTGDRTQQVQNRIVAELDELIKEAKKNASQCQGAQSQAQQQTAARTPVAQPKASPNPSEGKPTSKPKPAAVSNAPPGTGEAQRPEADDREALVKDVWGNLPLRDRHQMLEPPSDEEFLPKYESMIVDYYKRLLDAQRREKERGASGNDE